MSTPPKPPGPPPTPPPPQGNDRYNVASTTPLGTIDKLAFDGIRTIEDRGPDGKVRTRQVNARIQRRVNFVGSGTRFLHYFIDTLLPTFIVIGFMIWYVASQVAMGPRHFVVNQDTNNELGNLLYLLPLLYLFIMEWLTSKTVGKYITGTIVVNKFGLPLTPSQAGMRTILRIIPFEPFSFLGDGRGWHDTLSETYVVKHDEAAELQRLMREQFPDHPEYVKFDAKL